MEELLGACEEAVIPVAVPVSRPDVTLADDTQQTHTRTTQALSEWMGNVSRSVGSCSPVDGQAVGHTGVLSNGGKHPGTHRKGTCQVGFARGGRKQRAHFLFEMLPVFSSKS